MTVSHYCSASEAILSSHDTETIVYSVMTVAHRESSLVSVECHDSVAQRVITVG